MMRFGFFIVSVLFIMRLLAEPFAIKEEIETYKAQLENANDRSEILLKLSKAYFSDQQLEKAIETFLESLEAAKIQKGERPSQDEMALYQKILTSYLQNNSEIAKSAQEVLEEYSDFLDDHPNYQTMKFLIAAAYANVGDFNRFFDLFYQSYVCYPDSYMAHRTKAVLYTKLYERAKTIGEREKMKSRVFYHVKEAIEKNFEDLSLYKMCINFSTENTKPHVTKEMIELILKNNLQVPRKDIRFYVVSAVDTDQKKLAQSFLDKAKEWYSCSRAVERSQCYLERN